MGKVNLKWLDIKQFILKNTKTKNNDLFKDLKLDRIKYFTAHISEDDKNSLRNQQIYLDALRTIDDVEIIFGKFKNTFPKGYLWDSKKNAFVKPKKIVTITKPEEKESDVNIGIHLISDCYEKRNLKGIILVTSDTDLTPVLSMIKLKFPHIKIMHIRMTKKGSISLKEFADIKMKVSLKHLKSSQFPETVINDKGIKIQKPTEWKD